MDSNPLWNFKATKKGGLQISFPPHLFVVVGFKDPGSKIQEPGRKKIRIQIRIGIRTATLNMGIIFEMLVFYYAKGKSTTTFGSRDPSYWPAESTIRTPDRTHQFCCRTRRYPPERPPGSPAELLRCPRPLSPALIRPVGASWLRSWAPPGGWRPRWWVPAPRCPAQQCAATDIPTG